MKKEKREEVKEKKEIVVLDAGVDMDDIVGPTGICCGTSIMPLVL